MQTLFAACTAAMLATGCTNDEMTAPDGGKDGGNGSGNVGTEPSVVFTLGLPAGDEVNYTRASTIDSDATEWAINSMKVYHFCATVENAGTPPEDTKYLLQDVYSMLVKSDEELTSGICLDNGNGSYSLKLALRTAKIAATDKHAFAFVANDSCSTFDANLVAGTTTLADLKKQVADKQVKDGTASPTLFMGNPAGLCMTAEIKDQPLTSGINTVSNADNPTQLTRIMARLDVKNFVSQERAFELKSVRLLYSGYFTAPKGYLFAADGQDYIWNTAEEKMTITQNAQYDKYGYMPVSQYTTESGMKDAWVSATTAANGRSGVWYKKVLYMYEFPDKMKIGTSPTTPIVAEVKYTLNGLPGTAEVKLQNDDTVNLKIARNTVYTLQVGETSTAGGALTFKFVQAPWTMHEIDVDLSDGKESIP